MSLRKHRGNTARTGAPPCMSSTVDLAHPTRTTNPAAALANIRRFLTLIPFHLVPVEFKSLPPFRRRPAHRRRTARDPALTDAAGRRDCRARYRARSPPESMSSAAGAAPFPLAALSLATTVSTSAKILGLLPLPVCTFKGSSYSTCREHRRHLHPVGRLAAAREATHCP